MAESTDLNRRAVLSAGLATAVAVSVSSCSVSGDAGAADDSADVALAKAALAEEAAFGALCAQLEEQNRGFARRLRAVAATQQAHVDALSDALAEPPTTSSVPPSRGSIASVSREATRLHRRRAADCLAADTGALAQLFGSIAASHAVTARYWRTR